jgi:hypothetical protein
MLGIAAFSSVSTAARTHARASKRRSTNVAVACKVRLRLVALTTDARMHLPSLYF